LRGVVIAAALAAALGAPATASALTYTVDKNANVPDGQCTSDTHVCKTIFDANNAVHDGDTVDIKGNDKPYVEQPIVVKRKNVTFEALPGTGTVTITGVNTLDNNDVFTLGDATGDTTNGHGDGTTLRGLTITSQPQGGRAVFVRAANTTVDNCTLIRQELTDTDVPVYDVEDTLITIDSEGNHIADGPLLGTQTVKNSVIIQKPRADSGLEAPALFGGDSSSLILTDDFIVTGQTEGPAVVYTGNDVTGDADKGTEQAVPNLLVRSYVLTGGDSSNAIEIKSNWDSDTPKALNIDSSIISAGPHGIGVKAESVPYPSGGPGLGPLGLFPRVSRAGDTTIVMDESTVAGSDQGVVLGALADASVSVLSGPSSPHGNIYMDVDRSIVHGSNTVINNPGDGSPLATRSPNEADLRFLDSDVWDTDDFDSGTGATMEVQDQGNTNTPDAQLFVNPAARDYHLRPDAPVIDKAGKPKIGESDKDYEGDARVWGAAADRGGDEFVDKAPSAVFGVSKTPVREGEVVTFDGSASKAFEGDYGNPIIGWAWDFGDGTKQITTTPTVTHKYATRGNYTATLVAIDKFKMLSSPATQAVAVQDGIAPTVTIVQPKAGEKIAVLTVGRKAKGKTTAKKPAATPKAGQKGAPKAAPKAVKSSLRVKLIRVAGTAKDDSGVAGVQIAIRRISAGRPARTAAAKRTKQCTFFDPAKAKFMKKPCRKPTYFNVHLVGANWDWAYRIKHNQFLRTGTYEIQARGIDKFGNVSTPVLRRFRVG
jgi:hypothetical protein